MIQLNNDSNDYQEYAEDYGNLGGWFDDVRNFAQRNIFDPISNAIKPYTPAITYNLITGQKPEMQQAQPPAPRQDYIPPAPAGLPKWVVPAGIGLVAFAVLMPLILSKRR